MRLLSSTLYAAILSLASSAVLAEQSVSFEGASSPVSQGSKVLESTNFCKMDKDEMIGSTCDLTFKEINDINKSIRSELVSLVQTDFFKYFKLDLYKQCPFWNDNNAYCVNRACSVDVVEDWDNLPEYWQPEVLGSLNKESVEDVDKYDDEDTFLDQLCSSTNQGAIKAVDTPEENDIDYCDMEDFSREGSVLVDLSANPERFTGYGGNESAQIWSSIYRENCFSLGETGQSLAKDAFYRLMSGLHASIGTHLSNEHLNTETGKWEPDLDLFMARVGNFPDRVSNMYFNYAIVSKALWKIRPYLSQLEFCNSYNEDVKSKIINIISKLDSKIFNEDLIFEDDLSSKLKDDFRLRFKNVTKIMDCVHCDRCRLWGKVQTTGYATSLKILFELDEADEESKQNVVNKLTKFELISLFNTMDRLSKSIESVNNFERLYNERADNNGSDNWKVANNFFKLLTKAKRCIKESVDQLNSSLNSSGDSEGGQAVKEQRSHVFKDLKMPEKKVVKNLDAVEGVWKKAWKTELHNVGEAFKFIYRSYFDLPKNLWNTILTTMNRLWNRFVGVANYVPEEEEDPAVYKLDIQ